MAIARMTLAARFSRANEAILDEESLLVPSAYID
jgi:hypothetical protein